jgi:hypothetical protein
VELYSSSVELSDYEETIMNKLGILTLTALVATPALAGAQQSEASAEARAEARVEVGAQAWGEGGGEARSDGQQNAAASAEAVLEATLAAGLPDQPVRRTIAEGRAKGATEAQVTKAAVTTHARLLLARTSLEGAGERRASHAEIALGAEALLNGAGRGDLERIRDAAPAQRSLEASLQALVAMQAQDTSALDASMQIATRLAGGANDSAIAALAGVASGLGGSAQAATGGALGVTGSAAGAASTTGSTVGAGIGVAGAVGGRIKP